MPFSKRVGAGYGDVADPTTSSITDATSLSHPRRDYWTNQWIYFPASGNARMIVASALGGKISFYPALAAAPSAGDDYEILSVFSPFEIHEAINQAIMNSYPSFFETVEDDSLVICEDKLEYDLTSISPTIGIVHEVAIERPVTRKYTEVESATGDPLVVTLLDSTDLSDVDTTWRISFYDGTGRGQEAAITAVGTHTVTIAVPTTSPVDGTKALLWDPNDEQLGWYRIKAVHFSSKQWPSYMRLYAPIYSYRGSRIRIKYSTIPSSLTAETSTTVVPSEFVVAKAISLLAKSRVGDNRVDRQRYAALEELYTKESELFKLVNYFQLPDTEIWMEGNDLPSQFIQDPDGDPLNWR